MDTFGFQIVAIVGLLVANGFFVASEFALVSARGFRIESRARSGSRTARLTLRIKTRIDSYLAACQLGITMASLGLGWMGEPAVAALLRPLMAAMEVPEATQHTIAFIAGFAVFSSLHIVIGEQVPKTYAIRKAESIALAIAYPLHWFTLVIYPLNWLLNAASSAILRLLRVAPASHAEVLTSDELRGLIRTSATHGEVDADRAQMLHNLFGFDERPVEQVMIPRREASVLRLDAPASENLKLMQSSRYSRFPVVKGSRDNLVGVILMRDLATAFMAGIKAPWERLETYCRAPLVVPETLKVSSLFETMRAERNHLACIVDEYGTFSGLVTLEDLLEEIVGEIADETDKAEPTFSITRKDGYWEAHGLASLADVERELGFNADPGQNANTISGLVMALLERMPVRGDAVTYSGFKYTVLEMKGHRVERARIETSQGAATDEPHKDEASGPADQSAG